MPTYKTKAIILSSYPYREHDRIVSLYSREYGRMDARSRGARKIQSKLAGHLEPFIETELLLARGKRWDILAGSRTTAAHRELRGDISAIAAASVCVEAVRLITKPLAADGRVFWLLGQALRAVSRVTSHPKAARLLAARFLWQLLALSGFAPELNACITTRVLVASGSFSFEGGGVLCEDAARHDPFAVPVDAQTLAQLRENRIETQEAEDIVVRYWRRVVDFAELRSWKFLTTI